jgi:hypothetical protein
VFLILLNFAYLVQNVVIIFTNQRVYFVLYVFNIFTFEFFFQHIVLVFGVVDFNVFEKINEMFALGNYLS